MRCPAGTLASVPEFSHVPGPSPNVFQHMFDRVVSVCTLPRWFTLLGGRMNEQCDVAMARGILLKIACRQMGTD
jgi:hypothetical protein